MALWGRPLLWCGPWWKWVWQPWFRLSAHACLWNALPLSLTGLPQPSSARFGSGPERCQSAASAYRSLTELTVSPPAEPWLSWRLPLNLDIWREGSAGGEQPAMWQGPKGSTLFYVEVLMAEPTCPAGSSSCLLPRPACSGPAAAPWTRSSSETLCSQPRMQPERLTQQCVKLN